MARAFVQVGLFLGLGLWSSVALAQGTGDVLEDEQEASPKEQSDDRAAEEDDRGSDGDWNSGGGGSSETGPHFGLRLAYGIPLGEASKGSDMSDRVLGQIPIWLDLGWQFSPKLMLGAYFSYGFIIPSSDYSDYCDERRADCTLSDMRLGLQAQLSFSPGRSMDPWLGVGAGYEWLSNTENDNSLQVHGWEYIMLQGGLDFGGDSGSSVVGPFVAFTYGTFSRAKVEAGGINQSGDIQDTASHSWLFLGVRGVVR